MCLENKINNPLKHSQFFSLCAWALSAQFFTLIQSSEPFPNSQLFTLCLHLGLSANTWICPVRTGEVARCCQGNRCRYVTCKYKGVHTSSKELGRRALLTSSSGKDHWTHLSIMRDLKIQGSKETCRLYFIWNLGSTVAQDWRCFKCIKRLLPNTSHWLEDTHSPYPCN